MGHENNKKNNYIRILNCQIKKKKKMPITKWRKKIVAIAVKGKFLGMLYIPSKSVSSTFQHHMYISYLCITCVNS